MEIEFVNLKPVIKLPHPTKEGEILKVAGEKNEVFVTVKSPNNILYWQNTATDHMNLYDGIIKLLKRIEILEMKSLKYDQYLSFGRSK